MNQESKAKTCFVIMPISDQLNYSAGHFDKVYEQIIVPAVKEAGFKPIRADSNQICDSIMRKILKNLIECDMAICDLSSTNPNVMYELGIRQAYGKKVVLIQDNVTDKIFDVSGINTVFYKSDRLYENVIKAKSDIANAIKETYENGSYSLLDIAGLKNVVLDNQQSKHNIQVSNRALADIMISQCKDLDELIKGTRDVDLLLEYYKKIATIVSRNEESKTITPEESIRLKNALSKINDRVGELRYNN